MLRYRRSRVFNVPCRESLAVADYAEASAINDKILGRKLSKQSWAIAPKIREVDDLLHLRPELCERIREAHPEVCFAAANGAPMSHDKAKRPGFEERRALLKSLLGEGSRLLAEAF